MLVEKKIIFCRAVETDLNRDSTSSGPVTISVTAFYTSAYAEGEEDITFVQAFREVSRYVHQRTGLIIHFFQN